MTSQAPDPKWLATFSALSEIPLKYTDRGEALQKITDLVKDAMGSHACTLVLVDPERRVLTQAAGSGASEEFERFMRTREVRLGSPQEGASIHYDLLARGEAVVRYNLDNDGQGIANRDVARRYGLTAGLMFPLKSNGRVRGYLNHFLSQSRPFTEDEERVLGIFAHQAENILERFEQYQSQERLRKILNDLSQSLLNQPPDVFIREVPRKACELGVVFILSMESSSKPDCLTQGL